MNKTDIPDFWAEFQKKTDELNKRSDEGGDVKLAEALDELNSYVDNVLYQKIQENWIIDSDTLSEMLDLYILSSQNNRCYKIVYIMVRHYRPKLDAQMKKWIELEEFEKCHALRKIIFSI